MADQAQHIERIKNLEQTNQVLVESNHYYKNHIDQLNQMINDLKRYRFVQVVLSLFVVLLTWGEGLF